MASVHLSLKQEENLSGLDIFFDAVSTISPFWHKAENRAAIKRRSVRRPTIREI